VPRDADDATVAALRDELEGRLHAAMADAERRVPMIDGRLDAFVRHWWAGELGRRGGWPAPGAAGAGRGWDTGSAVRRCATVPTTAVCCGRERVDIPVISIGNIAVGGTGKTPFTLAGARLQARGETAGHPPRRIRRGRTGTAPPMGARHPGIGGTATGCGAARRRSSRARRWSCSTTRFQHRRLHRDLDIVLASVEGGAGRRGCCRAGHGASARGRWVARTWSYARAEDGDTGRCGTSLAEADCRGATRRPVCASTSRRIGWSRRGRTATDSSPRSRSLAVAWRRARRLFAADARAAGAEIAETHYFPDHHEYTAADAGGSGARAAGRPVVTTEKDWTKLATGSPTAEVWLLRAGGRHRSGPAGLPSSTRVLRCSRAANTRHPRHRQRHRRSDVRAEGRRAWRCLRRHEEGTRRSSTNYAQGGIAAVMAPMIPPTCTCATRSSPAPACATCARSNRWSARDPRGSAT
jgi:tetraacyldisaccharide 4'-kinase